MFVPEIRLRTWDGFLRQTKGAKALVADFNRDQFSIQLTLQCFDGNVVWSYKTFGPKSLANLFDVEEPKFEKTQDDFESYDSFDWARRKFLYEYFWPHFEAQFLDTGYVEGCFKGLVMVAEEEY